MYLQVTVAVEAIVSPVPKLIVSVPITWYQSLSHIAVVTGAAQSWIAVPWYWVTEYVPPYSTGAAGVEQILHWEKL
jgi:hypothetical protein